MADRMDLPPNTVLVGLGKHGVTVLDIKPREDSVDREALAVFEGHVWKLLRALKWSPQRPVGRARERNEQAIREWPELNPVEYIWGYWKQHELPNVCPKEYWELDARARKALRRMRRKPTLVAAFWKQSSLCLD